MPGLRKIGTVGKVVKDIVMGRQTFKHHDGLFNVEGGCVQNISNIEKQRRHMRTVECSEEIEATIDAGAACFVFP